MSLVCVALSFCASAVLADCKLEKVADLPVTMAGYPLVDATVNGTTLHFIADSGAFFSMISPAVAAQLGLKVTEGPNGLSLQGLGGVTSTKVARVRDFDIAGSALHNIEFLVAGNGLGPNVAGAVGQNILGYADVEYDLANGMIRLWKPVGCGAHVLAYWLKKDQTFGQLTIEPTTRARRTTGAAMINGHRITATFDTGGGRSYVTRSAAQRAGIPMSGPGVEATDRMAGGVGLETFRSFIAPVQSFDVGGEEIRNTHLRVGDAAVPDSDMLIGIDFFLSHRVYVSNAQQRLYFTYNGGPVFDISLRSAASRSPDAATPSLAAPADSGLDAAALARRGDASAARGNYGPAIADLTRARAAAPNDPDVAYDRARVQAQYGRADFAMADANDAIRLAPDHVLARMLRAELWIARSDMAGARADLDAAARSVPKSADAHMALADLYARAEAPDLAIGQYTLWLDSHPEDVGRAKALNGRCWARAILGRDLAKALGDCDAALRSRGRAANILDSRGLVYLRLGRLDKAIADYDGALAINPKIAWSLYGRGIAKLRLGKTTEGGADIAAATALAPKLPAIAKGYGVTP
jgi:tetratricopeptide (TPR) repeat protein/predicted aspartyl protease